MGHEKPHLHSDNPITPSVVWDDVCPVDLYRLGALLFCLCLILENNAGELLRLLEDSEMED